MTAETEPKVPEEHGRMMPLMASTYQGNLTGHEVFVPEINYLELRAYANSLRAALEQAQERAKVLDKENSDLMHDNNRYASFNTNLLKKLEQAEQRAARLQAELDAIRARKP